jgi:hypothetical protein
LRKWEYHFFIACILVRHPAIQLFFFVYSTF